MYTLDTNAIIYYLNGENLAIQTLEKIFSASFTIYISVITEMELLSFSSLSPQETQNIEQILRTLTIIPVDSKIARIAAQVRRIHRTKAIDACIAATALHTRTTLVTRNIKDFEKIKHFQLMSL